MSNNPLISIITISYNEEKTIEKTIQSVISQSYPNIEYIIIDGGSTDKTTDIIKKYSDKISYWISEKDEGIYDAMNKGIKKSKGKWLNFMNAGDCFYNSSVIYELSPILSLDYDYITGIAVYPNGHLWKPVNASFSLKDVFYGGGVNHQASFIKRSLFEDGYDCRYKIIADEKFFFEKIVMQGYSYLPMNKRICYYDNKGISNNATSSKRIKEERKMFFMEILPKKILDDYISLEYILYIYNLIKRIKRKIQNIFTFS